MGRRGRGGDGIGGVSTFVHPTAIVDESVEIGEGTSVWDHAHLRGPTAIGDSCIVGGKTYVAGGVTVGDLVKLNSFVYVCSGVTIERGAMVAAGVTFTNDRYPRATDPELTRLQPSEPDEHTQPTVVRRGATIGARAVVGSDLVIGPFAMVGMGAVVTASVPEQHLVVGNPARSIGIVCRCGEPVARFNDPDEAWGRIGCDACGRKYHLAGGMVEAGDG